MISLDAGARAQSAHRSAALHRRAVARRRRALRSLRHDAGLRQGGAAARRLGRALHARAVAGTARATAPGTSLTDKGAVHAEHVVNCGGLWAREVGHMVGIELPVLAMEHHYLLPRISPSSRGATRRSSIPPTTPARSTCARSGGGALIGTYEPHGVVWSPLKTPDDFSMQLLPDDFERLAPYFEVGFQHFPALGRVGIRKAVNGPFTFAPDGNPLVGPVRGLRNYWVACAVMAGFSQGGGIGLVLSRWMAENDPGPGHPLDGRGALRRASRRRKYTSIKVPENYARRFRLAYPNEELPAARPRAPLADLRPAAATPAPSWVRTSGSRTRCGSRHRAWRRTETPTYRRSEAFPDRAAPSVTRCATPSASTRPRTTASTRSRAAARAPGSTACSPRSIPQAGPARAGADAESGGPHRRRPVDRLPRRRTAT